VQPDLPAEPPRGRDREPSLSPGLRPRAVIGRLLPLLFALAVGLAAVLPSEASACPRAADQALVEVGVSGGSPGSLACAEASGATPQAVARAEVSLREPSPEVAPQGSGLAPPPVALRGGAAPRPRPPTAGPGEALRTVVLRV
jgi:hypothetical protein